jgi:hypothetical protein
MLGSQKGLCFIKKVPFFMLLSLLGLRNEEFKFKFVLTFGKGDFIAMHPLKWTRSSMGE